MVLAVMGVRNWKIFPTGRRSNKTQVTTLNRAGWMAPILIAVTTARMYSAERRLTRPARDWPSRSFKPKSQYDLPPAFWRLLGTCRRARKRQTLDVLGALEGSTRKLMWTEHDR